MAENIENNGCSQRNSAVSRDEYNKLVDKLYAENETVTAKLLSELKLEDATKQKFVNHYCVFDSKGYAKISADKIDEKLKFSGIMVLLSDAITDAKEAYFAYERRNTVESNFQIFKDHLNFDRIYIIISRQKVVASYETIAFCHYFKNTFPCLPTVKLAYIKLLFRF